MARTKNTIVQGSVTALSLRLKTCREAKGLTISELSSLIGVPERTISSYERDERKPSVEYITLLHTRLCTSSHWLLTGDGEMFANQPEQAKDEKALLTVRDGQGAKYPDASSSPLTATGEPVIRESASPYLSESDELEILQAVVSGVEKYCIVYDVTMPPEKKGLRIATIFERCRREYIENIKELTEQGKLIELKKAPIESEAKDLCELVNKLA